VARNIGHSPVVILGKIPFAAKDNRIDVLPIKKTRLRAGESQVLPMSVSATLVVKAQLKQPDIVQGGVGLEYGITIKGFVTGQTTIEPMAGITSTVNQVVPSSSGDDQILATFKIAANAAQGNRQVKVKVRGVVSNALNFLVQVPDAVMVETMETLQKIDSGPSAC
jgi:hypothetical protein